MFDFRPLYLLIAGSLISCGDQGITAVNASPEAVITSHATSDVVYEGYLTTLRGAISDDDDSTANLVATWYVNSVETCPPTSPNDLGETTCEVTFDAGAVSIILQVKDPQDATGTDNISLTVQATDAPSVTITSPLTDANYYEDSLITFSGVVSDGEDSPEDLTLSWESSAGDSLATVDTAPDSSGTVTGFGYLTEGQHAIKLYAEDTSGKTGSDSVVISVGPPNTNPSCEITSPEDNAIGEQGQSASFTATVSDGEIDADDLTVAWSSDKDGEMGESIPTSNGEVNFAYADLSTATHTVTMVVTDDGGGTCTDNVVFTVGQAPVVAISAPADGEIYAEGSSITFAAVVSDSEDATDEIDVVWSSDIDGELNTTSADSDGTLEFTIDSLSSGEHTVSLTTTDPSGFFTTEIVTFTVNGLPSAPEVSLSPDPAYTDNDLVVTMDTPSVDPEGDTITYSYEWYQYGTLSSASTTGSLDSAYTARDETWSVVVTPNDGMNDGASTQVDIVITNTIPVLDSASLDATEAYTDDTLTCTPGTSYDEDGDSVSYTYAWEVSGSSVSATGAGLSGAYFDRGDTVSCTITPSDGTDDGAAVTSDEAEIINSLPEISTVEISPDPAVSDDTLTCTWDGFSDDDDDEDLSSIEWQVDGVSAGVGTELADAFISGQEVSCTVTPFDGEDYGAEASASVTIGNSAPTISDVFITPDPAVNGDELACFWTGFDDVDGDDDESEVEWLLNGSSVGTGTTLLTDLVGDDLVECTVTPFDGSDYGTAITAELTISNSVPSIDYALIEPDPATVEDALACTWVNFIDNDSDADLSTLVWEINGSEAGTSTTLESGYTGGDNVTCSVTPYDGKEEGDMVAASITIDNTAPSISAVEITPDPATTSDVLLCAWSDFEDADGDADQSEIEWTVDGVSAGSGITLSSGFTGGDTVQCTVTPYDGTDYGTPLSTSVTIDNSVPSITSAEIAPIPANSDDTLLCSWSGYSDDDGDPDQSTVEWTVNGVVSGTDITLAGSFIHGDEVICTVTPYDGHASGTAIATSITIDNAPPSIVAVDISPTPSHTYDELVCTWSGYADTDGDSDQSVIAWAINGTWVSTQPTLSDAFVYNDTVTCTVTPYDGEDFGAAVSESVTIANSEPSIDSVTISPNPAGLEDELTCSWDGYADDDNDADASVVIWTVNGSIAGTDTTLSSEFVGGDAVVCTVTPYDGVDYGVPLSDSIIIDNSPPTIGDVEIIPSPAYAADTLTCTWADYYDPDDDPDLSTVSWTMGSIEVGTSTTLSGVFVHGDEVTCTITPYDGVSTGTAVSTSTTIDNTAPSIDSVNITPEPATAEDTLSCAWSGYADDDGEDDNSVISWTVDGVYAGGSTDLTGGFQGGDEVTCTITPYDGTDYGTPISDSLTIANTPPVIATVAITPSAPVVGDTLVCSWSGYYDIDNDADESLVVWYINGTASGSSTTLSAGFYGGDTVLCEVTPYDGIEAGLAVDDSVTIDNSPPTISVVSITPTNADAEDDLTCSWTGYNDADGDTDSSYLTWSINGVYVSSAATISGMYTGGDEVTCVVTPYDGEEVGTEVSDSITLANAPPTISNVEITPDPAFADDLLWCNWDYNDADGDADYSYVSWTVDGVESGSNAYLSSAFGGGDYVICTVTPYDGSDVGADDTDAVTISNTPPVLASVTLTPTSPYEGDTLDCAPGAVTDIDNEIGFSYTYDWYVNGSLIAASSNELSSAYWDKDDEIYCDVTANDGTDFGNTESSNAVTVLNSPPEVLSATLSPSTLYTNSTASVSATTYDADGDTVDLTYAWYVNGSLVRTGIGSLGGSYYDRYDIVYAAITPDDATDSGTEYNTDELTVANTPPDPPTVTVTPSDASFNDDLTCFVVIDSVDDDGDTVTYSTEWLVDGYASGLTDDTVSYEETFAYQDWTCQVTPYDGYDYGDPGEDTIEIQTDFGGWADAVNDLGVAEDVLVGESSSDYSGAAVAALGDIDGDGYADIAVSAYGDDSYGTDAGKVYVLMGDELGLGAAYSLAYAEYEFFGEDNGDYAGGALAPAGDVDGDGVTDLLIGAYGSDEGGSNAGRAYLVLGSAPSTGTSLALSSADYTFDGENAEDNASFAVSGAGDVDGDGYDDFLIGAHKNDDYYTDGGKAYLISGQSLGTDPDWSLGDADWFMQAEAAADGLGYDLASAGDLDADGLSDVLISAYSNDNGGSNSGIVYGFFGGELSYAQEILVEDASFEWMGESANDYAGATVAGPGDVDGDGYDDALVGAQGHDSAASNAGRAYLLLGANIASGDSITLAMADNSFDGESDGDYAGRRVVGAGDVDGDGRMDFLIGAHFNDDGGGNAGKAYLILGVRVAETAEWDLADAEYAFTGQSSGDYAGFSMTGAGDINADGLGDLLLGSYGNDTSSSNAGATYVLFAPAR